MPAQLTVKNLDATNILHPQVVQAVEQFLANTLRIHSASLVFSANRANLVFVQEAVPCDDELSDTVSEFDIDLANRPEFLGINISMMAIPRVSDMTRDQFQQTTGELS